MTVQNVTPEKRYAANGVSLSYTIPFLLIEASDLDVFLNGVEVTSGFVLTGVGNPTSTITFSVPPLGDLYLVLNVPFQRLVDYQENGDFLSSTVNRDFDRIWQALKQLRLTTSRSPVLGANDIDGLGFYRAKGNGLAGLASANRVLDSATNYQDVLTLVTEIMATGQGPANNAFNVMYLDGNSVGQIIRDKLAPVANSIAALRNVLSIQYTHVFVSGYEPGTAGGGVYEYDAADTTSADNNGTIIVATDGGRWKLKFQQFVTVEQFGVLPIAGRNNFTRLQNAVAVCVAAKIELCGGSGVFECGSTLDISYPTLVFRGNGFRNTVFKFTGSGRAMDAIGTRPNNGIYSFDLDVSDFTIEGNPATTDLFRCRINHARVVRINVREASPTIGCGFRFGGTVAGHYEQLTMSTNTQLMSSRPANGIIFEADPTLSGARATCNTLLSPCIEGATGDGIVFNACDVALVLGGTSENCGGNGLTETAGSQNNSYLGFDCEHNLGFADIFIAGQNSNLTNCGSTKYTYIDNSARGTKLTGGWYDKVEVGVGAVGVVITDIKTRFFGGAVGLVTNNNPFLSTNKIFDATANAYVAYGKPATGVALTASPMTFTNVNITDETILIVGGTVTQIAYIRLGTPYLLNPASGCIRLQPGDGVTINYTGSPVITRVPGGSNNQ
ncbi:MAG: hypothetical protein HY309_02445 [Pseudomonas fluorescens]|nr:hypothetical protein [Pseudomonas fluorescens]